MEEDYIKKNYPNFPYPQPVECLNLLLRKEYGKQIVSGEKKVEWRDFSLHYNSRLIDKRTDDYIYRHQEDEELLKIFPTGIRPVKMIHFHNYNNTWSLDITVKENNVVALTEKGMKILHEKNIHDVDDEYEEIKKNKEYYRIYFFFVLGDIIKRENI